ncbi:VOC family protein [Actinomadura decatromicini]|uniref:VOC domain-containing protein n=1 Tax=Actinomadura decatromicini TaxID=2604572 RepID=A0A5D3FSS4_9ACTN|nr:VOC family protein [Actinomadura decatromicini]TYK51411.1 hypothetical protein FXF68_13485 [Actinomadura decatromicini]
MRVKALSHLAVNARDLDAWEEFATAVLGLAPVRDGDRLKLRLDERSYRFDVRAAAEDAPAWLGWEVATASDLLECRIALEEDGITVERGTAAEIADREVIDLLRFTDPDGLRHEVCLGASVAAEPVAFSRPGVGFVTGDLGLGHVALGVTDLAKAVDFFCGVLGFRVTDVMPEAFCFLRCNERHHSAALMRWQRPELHHVLLQALDLEQVGRSLDEAMKRGLVTKTLGRHAIDDLVSFYARTPSGWEMEIGFGGMRVGPDWAVRRVGRPFSSWGHRAVAT